MKTRRHFLKLTTLTGAGLMMPWRLSMPRLHAAQSPQIPLPGSAIPQFVDALPNLLDADHLIVNDGVNPIEREMREQLVNVLPAGAVPGYAGTFVWSYLKPGQTSRASYLGPVVLATRGTPDLVLAGVKLCWCKCPDAKPLASEWHERNGKTAGIDFRYIYETRAAWWPCDTYVPTVDRFLRGYDLLGGHIPTTGFSAIIDALACDPASVHVTGFDFFISGLHNVDERWKPGDPTDPIGHRPDLERAWLARNASAYPITFDDRLQELLA